MGVRKRIRDFKDWCPQAPGLLPTKLKSYSAPIAVVLAATLIFGFSFSLFSSQFTLYHDLPKVPVIQTPPENSSQLLSSPTPTLISQKNSSILMPKEEAIILAIPYINQYATENNRTISDVKAYFFNVSDWDKPGWAVYGCFTRINPTLDNATGKMSSDPQCWITCYLVVVEADNGKILEQQIQYLA